MTSLRVLSVVLLILLVGCSRLIVGEGDPTIADSGFNVSLDADEGILGDAGGYPFSGNDR